MFLKQDEVSTGLQRCLSSSTQGGSGKCRGASRGEIHRSCHTKILPSGPMDSASHPSKTQEMEHFNIKNANSPASFNVSEERRFHPRAAANPRPCSKSENSPAIFKAYITSVPDLHTPKALLTIHAQAAAILTRRLSFTHPVHRNEHGRP